MVKIETIKNIADIAEIQYTPQFAAICNVGHAPFNGYLVITYTPTLYLLEFESFEDWLRECSTDSYTIESFTVAVFDTLNMVLQPENLCVECNAQTQVHGNVYVRMETQ